MAEVRSFTKSDWYGYAGAEDFSNGDEPVIRIDAHEDKNHEFVFIGDGFGLTVDCQLVDLGYELYLQMDLKSAALAKIVIAGLPANFEELKKLGFEMR